MESTLNWGFILPSVSNCTTLINMASIDFNETTGLNQAQTLWPSKIHEQSPNKCNVQRARSLPQAVKHLCSCTGNASGHCFGLWDHGVMADSQLSPCYSQEQPLYAAYLQPDPHHHSLVWSNNSSSDAFKDFMQYSVCEAELEGGGKIFSPKK